jgi:cytoskeletal protein CcmA (bactofilin family)
MFFRKRSEASRTDAGAGRSLPGGSTNGGASSVIGGHTRFRGEISGGGALTIRGQVEGTIALRDPLSIEQGARIRANVMAPELILGGTAQGEMTIQRTLTLLSSGVLEGAVQAEKFRVEEGAVLNGSVRRRVEPMELPSFQSSS